MGAALARPGALRRLQRLRARRAASNVEVPRLGDQRAQQGHALRSIHHRADRGRHVTERDARPEDRHRLHRNTMLNQEAGVDDEEARWETLIDRVNATGTVWLGATIGCAQCHNHKYDPFTQKEYYKLLAFFDNYEYTIYQQPGNEGWVV